ncbi:MAG TPA: TerC family protein [Candidatus Limnocylindria bacterium]|nr:TerC family protein [Candidatus Limnocylindria bacterium]
MEQLLDPDILAALVTLTVLEIVLGVDNVVFISILSGKLAPELRERARRVGLSLAMLMRIGLLFSITWVIGLTAPLLTVAGNELSGRDLILIAGGLFLLGKATSEIHELLEGEPAHGPARAAASFGAVIAQILALDLVFSLDSVLTAVGLAEQLWVMVTAIVIAVGIMLVSSGVIAGFVHRHPTVKMLALAFLLLIGTALVAEGLEVHIPRGYLYFAMAFSVFVELLNIRVRARRAEAVELRPTYVKESERA